MPAAAVAEGVLLLLLLPCLAALEDALRLLEVVEGGVPLQPVHHPDLDLDRDVARGSRRAALPAPLPLPALAPPLRGLSFSLAPLLLVGPIGPTAALVALALVVRQQVEAALVAALPAGEQVVRVPGLGGADGEVGEGGLAAAEAVHAPHLLLMMRIPERVRPQPPLLPQLLLLVLELLLPVGLRAASQHAVRREHKEKEQHDGHQPLRQRLAHHHAQARRAHGDGHEVNQGLEVQQRPRPVLGVRVEQVNQKRGDRRNRDDEVRYGRRVRHGQLRDDHDQRHEENSPAHARGGRHGSAEGAQDRQQPVHARRGKGHVVGPHYGVRHPALVPCARARKTNSPKTQPS
mmetsp:Transcript_10182/g.20736  ORF Transcript_10182/g.20736 Transcript_10182/m.20736 type:complete len:347 (-) Transcript_10182:76-1116(-)